jgi:hypothetical protein
MFNKQGVAMARYKLMPYPRQPGLVWISARRLTEVVAPEVAERFKKLVERARPRGGGGSSFCFSLPNTG